MTAQAVYISLVTAITTAFITALLNNHYWKRQLKDEEKSEYRKLYHKRKLEVYEKLALFIAEMTTHLIDMRVNLFNPLEARKEYERFQEGYMNLLKSTISNALYISGHTYMLTNELGPFMHDINSALLKNDASINDILDSLTKKIADTMNAIREELGIPTLLYGSEMQELLSVKENIAKDNIQ